ncbi:TetR/AcrR family transcriptional regulator [Desulfosporosinus sp. OT]|uniref:TetR/AcrR family transcriptional regulator n=1 Tax=Desulfosporosinus sp. OT TaxID=913865 RepID=UPI0002239E59|nr:TetR/AcrR family transcriptional regulator [Desulfosporosinus sp. OT]EGW39392.1 bacterial regulatory s, tetR family protein [Desulfosporosinus sp. OT]
MYSNFENLSEAKKKNILDACIHEFAEKGYEQASTNTIVKEAGISKGILFHYFKNKRGLFLYVVDYCFRTIVEAYNQYPLQETKDIFQRLSEVSVIKLKLTHENPEMSKIIVEALVNSQEDIRTEIDSKYRQLSNEYMSAFFQEIDYSKFRRGVNPAKAIEIMMLFLKALGDKYVMNYQGKEQELLQNYDQLMEEYNEYMEILKYGMYSSLRDET